jgi:hypothetical protein
VGNPLSVQASVRMEAAAVVLCLLMVCAAAALALAHVRPAAATHARNDGR